jgi:hypothetical protein
MRSHAKDDVLIPLNDEIKAPVPVYPALPDVIGFVILLCVKRGVMKVAGEQANAFWTSAGASA